MATRSRSRIDNIHNNRYLLPAIQREFVWRPHQIERLFDSLMRGYPIGSFLFWRVDPEPPRTTISTSSSRTMINGSPIIPSTARRPPCPV